METDTIEEELDGTIHSIHVRNFFCHENLEITFNKNVNFVVGRNGSGKSAILTALVVGLGGRASATNRGSNLTSFIRKGANSASVEIKINNSSAKAFKPDVYGDFITITRSISASGGSSYKVKSSSGDVISTKYEEVNAIILAHDIQVDNPISVLNQDDARSFHAADAKKKYSLFRKATNLDQTEHNYVRAIENCTRADMIWKRKHEASLELEKEYKKWEASYEQLQSRDEIEATKQALQNEFYWSELAEYEAEADTIQAQYQRQSSRIDKLMEKLNAMERDYGSNSDVMTTLRQQIEEKQQAKSALERELGELDSSVREAQARLRSAQQARAKCDDGRSREMRKVADLEREITNIDSGAASAATRRARLEEEASRAGSLAAAAAARCDTAQHDAAQAQAHAARAQHQHDQHAARVARQRDHIKQLSQQRRELASRGDDSLAVYGAQCAELCARVRAAAQRGHFSAPPRGPVGSYLKVREPAWGGALEHILGGSLRAFCVNSAEDSRKLFQIMGQVYGGARKPAVTCSKFLDKVHDVRRNKVRAGGHVSALEALDVSDAVVANYLIDNLGLEAILLVPEHEDAVRLSDNIENVPANCTKIVTRDSSEYYPAPNYRSYGGAGRRSTLLSVSTAERARQLDAEISEAKSTLASLEEAGRACAAEAAGAGDAARDAAAALQALLAERHRLEAEQRRAQAAVDAAHAPHHAVLVEELEVSRQKLSSLGAQAAAHAQLESEQRAALDERDDRMRRVKRDLAQLTQAARTISEELEHEQLKQERGASERAVCAQRAAEERARLEQLDGILREKRALVEDKTRQALELCARVENPREKSLVCAELKKTQMKLHSMRSDGLTKAQVAERLLAVERKYSSTRRLLDRLKSLITEIQKTSDKHLSFCHKVQTYIARRVQYCFQSILTLRGYSGHMDIDNAGGSLQLVCSGRERGGARVASSTSSLSGGERSYSTVAFIMALWECVELPFYVMDEFDVFMDNVNRKIVMELLIDHALKNKSRQFVFLTPQDASAVSAGPHLKIHRMADPRS